MAIKATGSGNIYRDYYDVVSTYDIFDEKTWDKYAGGNVKNMSLDNYINTLTKAHQLGITVDSVKQQYDGEYTTPELLDLALQNEVYADREKQNVYKRYKTTPGGELVRKDGSIIRSDETYDENELLVEEYGATEYDYYKNILKANNQRIKAEQKLLMEQEAKNSVEGMWLKDIASLGITFSAGAAGAVDDIHAFVKSSGAAIASMFDGIAYNTSDEFVRAANQHTSWSQGFEDYAKEYERKYTNWRNIDGSYTTAGKYASGVVTSLGEMLPSVLIGMATGGIGGAIGKAGGAAAKVGTAIAKSGSAMSQFVFYAGMTERNIQDMYKQMAADGRSVSTQSILLDASIKSGLQWGIERLIGNAFGVTGLDNLVYGRKMSSLAGKTLTKRGVYRLGKDFLQEGVEEVFQDTSDYLVDQAHKLINKNYGQITDISSQSLMDAFLIGGIASFAGSARSYIRETAKMAVGRGTVGPDGKILNPIASSELVVSISEYMSAVQEIQNYIGKYKGTDKDNKGLRKAYANVYSSARFLSSIYNDIGMERFKAANQILETITKLRVEHDSNPYYIKKPTTSNYIQSLVNSCTGLLGDMALSQQKAIIESAVEKAKAKHKKEKENEKDVDEVSSKAKSDIEKIFAKNEEPIKPAEPVKTAKPVKKVEPVETSVEIEKPYIVNGRKYYLRGGDIWEVTDQGEFIVQHYTVNREVTKKYAKIFEAINAQRVQESKKQTVINENKMRSQIDSIMSGDVDGFDYGKNHVVKETKELLRTTAEIIPIDTEYERPVITENAILIPSEMLNSSPETIASTINEVSFEEKVYDNIANKPGLLETYIKLYKDFTGLDFDGDIGRLVVTELLYGTNQNFFEFVLASSDVESYAFLANLLGAAKLAVNLQERKLSEKLYDRFKAITVEYLVIQPYASISYFSEEIFSKEEITKILERRLEFIRNTNQFIGHPTVSYNSKTKTYEMTRTDYTKIPDTFVKSIRNIAKAYFNLKDRDVAIDMETFMTMISEYNKTLSSRIKGLDMTSVAQYYTAISSILSKINEYYSGKLSQTIYTKSELRFSQFCQSVGLDKNSIFDVNKASDSDRKLFEDERASTDTVFYTFVKFRMDQFENFQNNLLGTDIAPYVLEYQGSTEGTFNPQEVYPIVNPLLGSYDDVKESVSEITDTVYKRTGSYKGLTDRPIPSTQKREILFNLLTNDLVEMDKAFINLNDIFTRPELLKKSIRNDIQEDMGDLSPMSIYSYIKALILNDSDGRISITMDSNGVFLFTDMYTGKDLVVKGLTQNTLVKKLDGKKFEMTDVDIAGSIYKAPAVSIPISEFIQEKHLVGRLKNTTVQFVDGRNGAIASALDGEYRKDKNLIVIIINKDYQFQLDTLLHEFVHAVQYEYNTSNTSSPFRLTDKSIQEITDVINKHRTGKLLDYSGQDLESIISMLYYCSEEADAFGLSAVPWVDLYPVQRSGSILVMPTGERIRLEYDRTAPARLFQPSIRSFQKHNKIPMEYMNDITGELKESELETLYDNYNFRQLQDTYTQYIYGDGRLPLSIGTAARFACCMDLKKRLAPDMDVKTFMDTPFPFMSIIDSNTNRVGLFGRLDSSSMDTLLKVGLKNGYIYKVGGEDKGCKVITGQCTPRSILSTNPGAKPGSELSTLTKEGVQNGATSIFEVLSVKGKYVLKDITNKENVRDITNVAYNPDFVITPTPIVKLEEPVEKEPVVETEEQVVETEEPVVKKEIPSPLKKQVEPEQEPEQEKKPVKRKYIGAKTHPNLKAFHGKYISPELEQFVVNANEDTVPESVWSAIKNGTLTEQSLLRIFNTETELSQEFFDLVNEAFYKNPYVNSPEELNKLIEDGAIGYGILYAVSHLKEGKTFYEQASPEQMDELLAVIKSDTKLNGFFETGYGKATKHIQPKHAKRLTMEWYDGTLQSLSNIVNAVQVAGNLYWDTEDYKREIQEGGEDGKEKGDGYNVFDNIADPSMSPEERLIAEEEWEERIYNTPKQEKLKALSRYYGKKEFIKTVKKFERRGLKITSRKNLDEGIQRYINQVVTGLENATDEQINDLFEILVNAYRNEEVQYVEEAINAMYEGFIVSEVVNKDVSDDIVFGKKHTYKKRTATVSTMFGAASSKITRLNNRSTIKERVKIAEEYSDILELDDSKYKHLVLKPFKVGDMEGARNINKRINELNKDFDLNKYKNKKQSEQVERLRKGIKETSKKELERLKEITDPGRRKYEIKVGTTEITVDTDTPMPSILQKLLSFTLTNVSKSRVQRISQDDAKHVTAKYSDFIAANAKILTNLTDTEVNDVLDFYLTSELIPTTSDASKYALAQISIMGYLYGAAKDGIYKIESVKLEALRQRIEQMVSLSGQILRNWGEVIYTISPTTVILKYTAESFGIKFDENLLTELNNAVKLGDMKAILDARNKLYTDSMEQYGNRKRHYIDKLLQIQHTAMLSSPGTWIRNIVSNTVLIGLGAVSEKFGSKVRSILEKTFPTKLKREIPLVDGQEKQYKIIGTRVEKETIDFINKWVIENDLYNNIKLGLNKFKETRFTADKTQDNMGLLMASSIATEVMRNTAFKNPKLLSVSNWIYERLSDDKFIRKSFLVYLGKILTEDNVDLSRGLSYDVQKHIIQAYTMAAQDFMHKENILSKFEEVVRKQTGPIGYAMWKQILPFATASWNWFVEGLNYTPLGLGKAIVNFAKLEDKINRAYELESMSKTGKDIAPVRMTEYNIVKNLGKGVIGTIGFIAGLLLVAFGRVKLDDEDDRIKLVIDDNTYIDISQIFGTQGILMGMTLLSGLKDPDNDFEDVLSALIMQTLDDSVFSDLYNNFRYKDLGQYVMSLPVNSLSMFIPNAFKMFTFVNKYKTMYKSGFVGTLQRLAVQALPPIAYIMPHKIDPYTGQDKITYKAWWLTQFSNKLLPVDVYPYNVSEAEDQAISLGITREGLEGNYTVNDERITLNKRQTSEANKFYGQLNNKDLMALINNQIPSKVYNKQTNRYEILKYSQMTDKQKAAAMNTIMSKNAGYTKVYMLTQNGYRYYCSKDELAELRLLGITKNVYLQSGNKDGFVKN